MDPVRFTQLAREAALVAIPLQSVLPRLAGPGGELVVREWAPRDDDWEKVFRGPAADLARAFYTPVWAAPRLALGVPGDRTEVAAWAATPELLASQNAVSSEFPGGYRHVVPWMAEGRVWVAWRNARPGSTAGTRFDGLVWIDDHWAWFPKPWRALSGLRPGAVAEA